MDKKSVRFQIEAKRFLPPSSTNKNSRVHKPLSEILYLYIQACAEICRPPIPKIIEAFADAVNTGTQFRVLDVSDHLLCLAEWKSLQILIRENTFILEINLSNSGLTDEMAVFLGSSLGHSKHLEILDISSNQKLTGKGLQSLVSGMCSSRRLRVFNYSNNTFDTSTAVSLKRLLGEAAIQFLLLKNCMIGGNHLETALSDAFGDSTPLYYLDFRSNLISQQGFGHVARALHASTNYIVCLDFSYNLLDNAACQDLADAFPSVRCLQSLLLKSNNIGAVGLIALLEAVKASGLKVLDVSNNICANTIESIEAIKDCLLESTSLSHLCLENTSLHPEDACIAIGEALSVNKTLVSLNLQLNDIDLYGLAALQKTVLHNTTILSLRLGGRTHYADSEDKLAYYDQIGEKLDENRDNCLKKNNVFFQNNGIHNTKAAASERIKSPKFNIEYSYPISPTVSNIVHKVCVFEV